MGGVLLDSLSAVWTVCGVLSDVVVCDDCHFAEEHGGNPAGELADASGVALV